MNKHTSPHIESLSWGHLKVEGNRSFKDAKLYPGGACEWDWNETGTSHVPGIQPADVQELLEHGAEIVVLSKGINQRLRVKDETIQALENAGVRVHIEQTEKAVNLYNQLVEDGEAVGALIHSTC